MSSVRKVIAALTILWAIGITAVAQEAAPAATGRARSPEPVCKPIGTGRVTIQNLYCDDNPMGCPCPCNATGGCRCDPHSHCVPMQLE